MGASSTGGGTTSGRGGSGMAAWTGLSFGILRRVDGDEDLAPRVLAMAILEKPTRGARGLGSDRGGQTKGCSGLAPLWHLFEVQMIG